MTITPTQCRAARAGLQWSREYLAQVASLSERTVTDFEPKARDPLPNNKAAMRSAFERQGVAFFDANGIRFAGKPKAI
jgi:DNA-binding transcriptional regulator YiaG